MDHAAVEAMQALGRDHPLAARVSKKDFEETGVDLLGFGERSA